MSTPTPPAAAGTTPTPTPTPKKNYVPLAFAIAIAFLILVLPQFVNFKSSTNSDPKESSIGKNQPSTSYSTKTPVIEKTSYKISTEWTLVNIPYGVERIRFRNASVDYCAKNAVEEHCSKTTEDISGLFGNEKDVKNLQFWFKTKEGAGEITVELQYY